MKPRCCFFLAALVFGLPAVVFALGHETFGNAPQVKQPDWAEGVVDVVNLKSRVYGQWVNGNENLYYRGNGQALAEALGKYAQVKDEVRQVILLPGAGKTQTFDRKPIDFDWRFHVPSGIYKAVAKQDHAVLWVYVNALKPRPLDPKAVAKLLMDLDSDVFQTRDQARNELKKLGNDAKPYLRTALKMQPALETRRRIEGLLDRLPAYDVSDLEIPKGITVLTVDDLLDQNFKALNDPDYYQRGHAIQELTPLVSYNDKVIPAITQMLKKDKHEWVRRVAAGCLSQIGFPARSALPTLKEGLDDPDPNIRQTFQTAIEELEKAKENPGQEEETRKNRAVLEEIRGYKKGIGQ